MKSLLLGGVAALSIAVVAQSASASVFSGYYETSPEYYNTNNVNFAAPTSNPWISVSGTVNAGLNISKLLSWPPSANFFGLAYDVSVPFTFSGSALGVYDSATGALGYSLDLVGEHLNASEDVFSLLFDLDSGSASDYAIVELTGDFTGFTFGDEFSGEYDVRIVGAEAGEAPVVPLPAGLPLLIGGLGALGVVARRRRNS